MPDNYWISETQLERIKPYFPRSHGVPRVDDRRVISGIIHVIRNGLRWRDAPEVYGAHKTLYNRFVRWSRMGMFRRIFESLVSEGMQPEQLMIDATHLKAHRTAASLAEKGGSPRRIGRTKGGLNSKLHAVTNGEGKPIMLMLSEGQMSDHTGAKLLYPHLPGASMLIADKGYDSDEFRNALAAKGIKPCIPPMLNRREDIHYDKDVYRTRGRIEIMFGRLKGWRRIATRYDRSAHTFFSAICIAATVIFWL
ncbi:IS5 family transposase [Pelagibius litoralis]|uniref:IS5 family transposase n=1 Tax=Pelagibius litoralis TaxID=374515 RepID=A0A967KCG7_9PROT|nr:IS5 family transposase [Pelagibius litoralis]NIA69660.1 IS5 family transposase [Pelagibius litoralis]